jgi:hypothetical protein
MNRHDRPTDREVNQEQSREIAGMLTLVVLTLVCVAAWFTFYVQPHDEFLGEVMACMGNDASEAAYDLCAEKIRIASVR